jgi:hypothetical protein
LVAEVYQASRERHSYAQQVNGRATISDYHFGHQLDPVLDQFLNSHFQLIMREPNHFEFFNRNVEEFNQGEISFLWSPRINCESFEYFNDEFPNGRARFARAKLGVVDPIGECCRCGGCFASVC